MGLDAYISTTTSGRRPRRCSRRETERPRFASPRCSRSRLPHLRTSPAPASDPTGHVQESRTDHVGDQQSAATVRLDPINPADGVHRELCALLRLEIEGVEMAARRRSAPRPAPRPRAPADADRSEDQARPVHEQSVRDIDLLGAFDEDRRLPILDRVDAREVRVRRVDRPILRRREIVEELRAIDLDARGDAARSRCRSTRLRRCQSPRACRPHFECPWGR